MGFEREGLVASFMENGLKFIQLFLFAYVIILIFRMVKGCTGLEPFKPDPKRSLGGKIFCGIYSKVEYTVLLTVHQSSALSFSLFAWL